MLLGSHPSLDCKCTWIFVTLIIRDVFAHYFIGENAGRARSVPQAQTVGRDVCKEILPGHVLRVSSGHATSIRIPLKWWQAILDSNLVRLLESATLNRAGFGK